MTCYCTQNQGNPKHCYKCNKVLCDLCLNIYKNSNETGYSIECNHCFFKSVLQSKNRKEIKSVLLGFDFSEKIEWMFEFMKEIDDLTKENIALKETITDLQEQLLTESLRPPDRGGSEYEKGLHNALSNGFKN